MVSKSNTEAEFRSLATIATSLAWIQSLLSELRLPQPSVPTIYCDNMSAVLLAANPILHSRTKHFEPNLYLVCDKVVQKHLQINHIPGIE